MVRGGGGPQWQEVAINDQGREPSVVRRGGQWREPPMVSGREPPMVSGGGQWRGSTNGQWRRSVEGTTNGSHHIITNTSIDISSRDATSSPSGCAHTCTSMQWRLPVDGLQLALQSQCLQWLHDDA